MDYYFGNYRDLKAYPDQWLILIMAYPGQWLILVMAYPDHGLNDSLWLIVKGI
jgi:hypothetical protein